jgi:5-methyltetrahydrofolate--homocysteine methyltransferase
VKIDPHYSGPVIHVLDASKSVPVAGRLMQNEQTSQDIFDEIKAQYAQLRIDHAIRQKDKNFIPIEKARENHVKIDWGNYKAKKPKFLGTKVFEDYDLAEIAKYIDWTPFFQTWQLSGKYPKIFDDEIVGKEAKKLYDDAQAMLKKVIVEKSLKAKAVVGFYPANSVGDDIVLHNFEAYEYNAAGQGALKNIGYRILSEKAVSENGDLIDNPPLTTLHQLRQQNLKAQNLPNLCLSDYVSPLGEGDDYIGGFAVTAGLGIEALLEQYENDNDDYQSIMLKSIADRLAEAFTELMHERVRTEFWGYVTSETFTNDELISENYQGIRPAPGYPACPDHTEKTALFDLLDAGRIGIELTESFAMYPASSVSGWYFSHPESKYFTIGKIAKDQVVDYAKRKNMPLEEVEKWLAPVLNYD